MTKQTTLSTGWWFIWWIALSTFRTTGAWSQENYIYCPSDIFLCKSHLSFLSLVAKGWESLNSKWSLLALHVSCWVIGDNSCLFCWFSFDIHTCRWRKLPGTGNLSTPTNQSGAENPKMSRTKNIMISTNHLPR